MTLGVSAFYKFVRLPHFASLRQPLRDLCASHSICGTILLAPEGINGTLAGKREALAQTMSALRLHSEFADLESTESSAEKMPFARLKVRLKKEIVTLGVPDSDPTQRVGIYVAPEDWNVLISDAEVVVVDTRNNFEVLAGTFEGAINPGTRSFGEFPAYAGEHLARHKQRKIAMFCTGGIRCEKATAWLVAQGVPQVHHLRGGILRYLADVPEDRSLWRGACFVFDERVALGHGLTPATPPRPTEVAAQPV